MRISQLIDYLTQQMEKHGDMHVMVTTADDRAHRRVEDQGEFGLLCDEEIEVITYPRSTPPHVSLDLKIPGQHD